MSALREALRDLPDAVFADMLESNDAYLLVIDLPIPPDATAQDADAEMERGVLELRLPKESSAPATTIPVDERA